MSSSIIFFIPKQQIIQYLLTIPKETIMKKVIYILCAGLFLSTSHLFAQSKLAPNALHFLKTEQIHTTRGMSAVPAVLDAYISVDNGAELSVLEEMGVKVNLNLGDILTAQLPTEKLEEITHLPWVKYIQLAATPQQQMDRARAVTGVDRIHLGEGLKSAFTGKDVVVGIIDAGFDYNHPNFYTADGKTLRIKRVWEQSNTQGMHPEGFSYGAEYAGQEAIVDAKYDVGTNSHGTHVAGIAAGGYKGNNWYGVANEADIVLVSKGDLTPNNVNISDAIAYIYKYAESVGKPCVINMSLGMEIGPHDGTSIFDQVADRLQGPGKLLVGSAGNFKGSPLHLSKKFTSAEDAPLRTMVDYRVKPSTNSVGGEIDIWGEKGMKYDVQVVMNNYTADNIVSQSEVMDASKTEGDSQTYTIDKNGKGTVLITTEINPYNGKPHTYISLQVSSIRSRNAIGIIITPKSAGEVHLWADNTYVTLTDNDCDRWTKGNNEYTLAEIGGTGKNIISVGAYTTRNKYTPMGSSHEESLKETIGQIASFSSTGPAIDGRIKPEITAPGTYIISSVNSHDATLSITPLAGAIEGTNYCWGYMQGTSMAAPFVTGTVATWLEANPSLTPEHLRDILKATAIKDDFTGNLEQPNNGTWGYGKIDAYAGLKSALSMTGVENISDDNWVSYNYTKHSNALLFAKKTSHIQVTVYDITGKCYENTVIDKVVPGQEFKLNTSILPNGIYLVKVKNNDRQKSFKLVK